jgi:hypothetical protein
LVEWATFLGLATFHAKANLVLSPHVAVSSVLNDVFEGAQELTEDVFLSRLAQALPVLDRGAYRTRVEAMMPEAHRVFGATNISPALSIALETLAEQRLLRLEDRSDAPRRRVLLGRGGRERRALSHLVRLEVA